MRKFALALAFLFCGVFTSIAQTPTPTPPDDGDVVKISTTLIQVDVTVTDKKGKVITDLKPEEFEIFENDRKQNIANFSFVVAGADAPPAAEKARKEDKTAVAAPPSAALRPEQVRRTIALVVDDLGLSFESVYQVRRALRKFVDEQMQPNDLVAVVRTGGGMSALQQFTSDRRQLYAAIEAVKWNSLGRGGIAAFAPLEPTLLEQSQAAGNPNVSAEDLAEEQARIRSNDNFREDIFSVGTLGAINFIVKGLGELPGRKSIMLFSDGFQICSAEDTDRCTRLIESVRRLTDLSNRAAVSIYSFDARGLQVTGLTAADNPSEVSRERLQNLASTRAQELLNKQEGLAYLAAETGGRAFFNTNDINQGLEKALEDQKGYYLIGYAPDDETFDAKTRRFNKLQIKVTRQGAEVRYRSGFFGIVDEQIRKPANLTPAQQIQTALISPFAVSDIALRLNALFGYDKAGGSYVRSLLHVDAKNLKFTDEADGDKKAVFDVLAVSFGANGAPVDEISKTYTMVVKKDGYQKLLDEGFVYYFTLPVKKPGAYQYRVAIRDGASGKIGSANQFLEVPNLKKNYLTVSGIVLQNLTAAEWQNLGAVAPTQTGTNEGSQSSASNPMNDTSLRRFRRGTILRYGFEVYNARLNAASKPDLNARIRVFRDGKLILDGKPTPLAILEPSNVQKLSSGGGLSLGGEMRAGDYTMQIVVTDTLAKKKRQIATQFVQFEIFE